MVAPRGGARVPAGGGGKARHAATAAAVPPPISASARRRPRATKGAVSDGAAADGDDAVPEGPTTHLRFGGLGGVGQDEAEAAAASGTRGSRVPLTGAMAASLCVDRRKLKATAASYTHVDDLTALSSLAVVNLSNNALTDISGLAGCANLGHVDVVCGSSYLCGRCGPLSPVICFRCCVTSLFFFLCTYPPFRLLTEPSGRVVFVLPSASSITSMTYTTVEQPPHLATSAASTHSPRRPECIPQRHWHHRLRCADGVGRDALGAGAGR